nr:NAD-dependent DNA ligase LigA [Candidatus Sigynarchaeota archaeon]
MKVEVKPTREDELAEKIIRAKQDYYDGKPSISDAEYDRLENELRKINTDNPVLKVVGSEMAKGDVVHEIPMLSAEKLASVNGIPSWAGSNDIAWGFKVDGLSISLMYNGGNLIQGSTRGNGKKGENVTFQCFYLAGVPRVIDHGGNVEVRGEAYMPLSTFKTFPDAKSARNLATGTLKSKDPLVVAKRGIHFMAWDVIMDGKRIDIDKGIALLEKLGFEHADQGIVGKEGTKSIYERILASRDTYDFEMDGLIFKLNDATAQEQAGCTDHHPRWIVAVKFPSKEDSTVVTGMTWQVGRTRKITPVAHLEPVELGGATITNATCHNMKFILDNDIAIGDTVSIIRSGDVIPKITGVLSKGPNKASLPTLCPECGSPLTDNGTDISCTNEKCGEASYQRLANYIDALKIEQVGEKSLRRLWSEKEVKAPADLYKVSLDTLVEMFGKNGEKMHAQIHGKKVLPLASFLRALGIHRLSKVISAVLAKKFKTLDAVLAVTEAGLQEIDGVGPEIAKSIVTSFKDKSIYQPILDAGVTVVPFEETRDIPAQESKNASPIGGKRIYITGSVPGYKKDTLEALVTSRGGVWTSSVSKNMDILVLGDNFGPSKEEKARELIKAGAKINLMSAEEFLKLIS